MSTRHCQSLFKLRHHCCREHTCRKLALRILGTITASADCHCLSSHTCLALHMLGTTHAWHCPPSPTHHIVRTLIPCHELALTDAKPHSSKSHSSKFVHLEMDLLFTDENWMLEMDCNIHFSFRSLSELKIEFWKWNSIFNFHFTILTSIYQKTMNSITDLIKNAMNEMYMDRKW